MTLLESNIQTFAVKVLQSLGWQYVHSLAIAPGTESAKRESFEQIILTQRLCKAVARIKRDMLHNNEIHPLNRLRDTLLPKLIPGEIRVAKDKLIEVV